ncbi:MAG: FAD-dependent oxidoreductase [Gammaproteobacteria bacterium]
MAQNVLLVGGGHVNLHVAAHARSLIAAGARVVLVDPGEFWYSGLATGMLGGMFDAVDDQVDLGALIGQHGGEFVRRRVESIDTRQRCVHLAGGADLPYDYLSLNVGSEVGMAAIDGAVSDPAVWPVKPISNLWRLRICLEALFQAGESPRIVVVGGGPTGTEIAANIAALAARFGTSAHVGLVTAGSDLLEQAPAGARKLLGRKLITCGIGIRTRTRVVRRLRESLLTKDGSSIPADIVVVATGLDANSLVQTMNLPIDGQGGLRINSRLHSVADRRIFAGGDVAAIDGFDLPKLGVFGVRQAPYVHANLLASLTGEPLVEYHPQKRYLAILNLGDGTALSVWGPFWWYGQSSMWLKNRIDRRFLAGYRATPLKLSR